MNPLQRLVCVMTACVIMPLASPDVEAESKHVFGIHNWDWGADIDVMSGLSGWTTEADESRKGPNVEGRYAPMNAEGFTVIQRLDYSFDQETIPLNPAEYPTFASQCANNWAAKIKKYCRYYLIGNEVDLFPISTSDYANCFTQCRNAIRAVQPEAKVILGQWTNSSKVRNVIQILGPNGYDGVSAHTSDGMPTDLLTMLDEENARPEVGVYITEWGWVGDSEPNAEVKMLNFCQNILNWNANHDRQIYAATFYRYPCWDQTFNLQAACSTIDNPAFRNMTTNCEATNSYADNAVTVSNVRVQVSTTSEDLIARWHTDLPAKTMVWYRHATRPNGEFMPLQTGLVTEHEILIHNTTWLWANTEYEMVCRSPVWDLGNGNSDLLLVTTGPWTVSATNVTETSATITWQTLFPSSTRVEYGETTSYGLEAVGADGVTSHSVLLEGLTPARTYHYRVWSEANGYAPHHSADRTFQTVAPPGPFIEIWPAQISVTGRVLTSLPNSTFNIRNGYTSGTITYRITPNCDWITPVPEIGTSSGETDVIQLRYNTADLPAGEYSCTMTVTAPEAYNSPVVLPAITLTLVTVDSDFDGDGDVDQADFGHLQKCYSGPGIPQNNPDCLDARLTSDDDDVDQADLALFKNCFSGPKVPVPPTCDD